MRSASQSPRPFFSSTDIATSMFVLNWTRRSFVLVTAPLRMPWNSTPYLSSNVFASVTK